MKKLFAIAAAAAMVYAAINLSATPAQAGLFDDIVKGITGVTTTDLGSGR